MYSRGMRCIPARNSNVGKPIQCQALTKTSAPSAVAGSPSQGRARAAETDPGQPGIDQSEIGVEEQLPEEGDDHVRQHHRQKQGGAVEAVAPRLPKQQPGQQERAAVLDHREPGEHFHVVREGVPGRRRERCPPEHVGEVAQAHERAAPQPVPGIERIRERTRQRIGNERRHQRDRGCEQERDPGGPCCQAPPRPRHLRKAGS